MVVIVIGLGSMGKRRIRLLKKAYPTHEVIGIDSREDRKKESRDLFEIECCDSIEQAMERSPDCAFVCTAPAYHYKIIEQCLRKSLHVFTEINLITDGYEENLSLAKKQNRVLFLSSTPMYRVEMQYVDAYVRRSSKPVHYIYHVGQYLPDWHPWEKINEFFVSDKRTNGCRELMAIELPWMFQTFGKIKELHAYGSNLTKLNLSFQDSYQMHFLHENGNSGILAFNVVSRSAVRNLEVYNEDLYLSWTGRPESLKVRDLSAGSFCFPCQDAAYESQKGYSSFINEKPYEEELHNFFASIEGRETPRHSFEADKEILEFIDQIEGNG